MLAGNNIMIQHYLVALCDISHIMTTYIINNKQLMTLTLFENICNGIFMISENMENVILFLCAWFYAQYCSLTNVYIFIFGSIILYILTLILHAMDKCFSNIS